jgi:hypothetical protein
MDPGTAVLNVVDGALRFATTGLQTYQERVAFARRRETAERDEAEQARRRAEDQQLAREQYIRSRWDRREDDERGAAYARGQAQFEAVLGRYPVSAGPGALRRNVQLVHADPRTMPPLILIIPPRESAADPWRDVHLRIQASLMRLQGHDLAFVQSADRNFAWPDAALVENDLSELPAILLATEVVSGWLLVWLGGCNLGGDRPVRPMTQVAWTPLPPLGHWTEERLAALESTSPNGFVRPTPLEGDAAERALQVEWATRLAMVAAVAAVDAYHLLRRSGYAEQLDDAVAQLGPDATAQLLVPIPRGALADPAHHLLHQARRQLGVGAAADAQASVSAALETLGGSRHASHRESILAARAAGRMREWHGALLEELDAASAGAILGPDGVAALREEITEPAPPSPPPSPAAAPAAGGRREYRNRPVPITRGGDPEAPPGRW